MVPLNRILGLAAAGALVAFSAGSPARAEKPTQNMVAQADLSHQEMGVCSVHRRAISRHACQARLLRDVPIDTAENK